MVCSEMQILVNLQYPVLILVLTLTCPPPNHALSCVLSVLVLILSICEILCMSFRNTTFLKCPIKYKTAKTQKSKIIGRIIQDRLDEM